MTESISSKAVSMQKLMELSIDQIRPNEWNPNVMTEEEYDKLKTSIEVTDGKYLKDNPILVRSIEDYYEIIDGEHRHKVANDLGFKTLWCIIREMDDKEAIELCVILNKDRGDINYFKLSKLLKDSYEKYSHDLNQEELGRRFGYSRQSIGLILPIYENLKMCLHVSTFSNRQLIQLARIRNEALRTLLVESMEDKVYSSVTLQKIATALNGVTKYLDDKIFDLRLKESVLNRLVSLGAAIFDYDLSALKNEVDLLYTDEQRKRIIHGDMFDEIDELGTEFDCIFTDPPYNLSYENLIKLDGRKDFDRDKGEWDHFTPEEYLEFTRKWVKKAVDVLKPGGSMVVFTSDNYLSHLMDIIIANGLKKRNTIVWRKDNPPPATVQTNFVSSCEFMVYASKNQQKTFNWYGQNEMHNVISCPVVSTGNYGHPAQKPVELIEKILKSVTDVGDMVLDPFAGTGSTAVACENLSRGWIMIEKEEKYFKIMERRLLK